MSVLCSECDNSVDDDDEEYTQCESCNNVVCRYCIENCETITICRDCESEYKSCNCGYACKWELILCNNCAHPKPDQEDVLKFLLSKAGYKDMEAAEQAYCTAKKITLLHKKFIFCYNYL
jgi:hypothetical protein